MNDERDTDQTLAFGGDDDSGGSWLDEMAAEDKGPEPSEKKEAAPAEPPEKEAKVPEPPKPVKPAKPTKPEKPEKPEKPAKSRAGRSRRMKAAQRFLVDSLLPVMLGVGGMVGTYSLLRLLPPDNVIRDKMMERGWIPYACTVMLFWHLGHVVLRYFLRISPEFRVLRGNVIPAGVEEISDRELETIAQRAVETEDRGGSLLTRRLLLAVAHLRISRDTAELGDLLRRRADADRARTVTAYLIPKFLVWAIPIFGFVGTVLGVGEAIGKMKGMLESGGQEIGEMIAQALQGVAKSLAVAFDTTLIALLMSFVALFIQTLVQRQDAQLLADVEDYLTYRLQSRIRTETQDVRIENLLREALDDMKDLQQRMGDEQQERASISLQTMMNANDQVRDALGSMPQMLSEVSKSSAALMEETRTKMEEISRNIKNSLSAGIVEVVEKLEEAVVRQAEMGEETMRQLDDNAKRLGDQLGVGFREASGDLDKTLHDVSERLAEAVRDGKQLVELQNSLNENLDQLGRVQKLDETFGQVRDSLDSLAPLLDKLNKPIPLRLTFGGVEIEGASKSSQKFDL